jgi:hypothetical protein
LRFTGDLLVLIEFTKTQLPTGATLKQPSTTDPTKSADFEAQLSSALTESLQKLGVTAGEVDITIRNPTSTTRQIMVTYSMDGSRLEPAPTAAAPSVAEPTAAQPAAVGLSNPFSGYIRHVAPETVPVAGPTDWAPYSGPKDVRDQVAAGGGKTTATGSPLIANNETGAANQYGYTGPATHNPYFTTPSNPLRDGYVVGFRNWFADPMVHGGKTGPIPANKMQYSTEEGAQEALRIAKQFAPQAEVVQSVWQSGPFAMDKPIFEIDLGGGHKLNAGGVLCGYYNQGYGVTISSDETIRRAIQLA